MLLSDVASNAPSSCPVSASLLVASYIRTAFAWVSRY